MGNLSPEDIHNQILNFETQHNLLRFKSGAWCIWPLFRFRLSLAFYQLPLANRKGPTLFEYLNFLLRDVLTLLKCPKSNFVGVSFSSARADQVDGKAKDIFFDDIAGKLGTFFKIEKPNNPKFFFPKERMVFPSQFSGVLFRLISMFFSLWPFHRETRAIAEALNRHVREDLGVEFLSTAKIYRRICMFDVQRTLYAWLFRRLKAKVLLSADGYGDFDFFAAAKQAGMTTIDLQHGFVDRFHCGYSWGEGARAMHAHMPIADWIFSFGEIWREDFEASGFWRDKVKVIGNVWLDQYRKKRWPSDLLDVKQGSQELRVVVTTQGIDTPGLIQFFRETLQAVGQQRKVRLTFKLHPILETDTSAYENLKKEFENIEVLLGSSFPSTPHLIAQADLHCTISSTCHFDALALGTPTVILPLNSFEIVLKLAQEGFATVVKTPTDLAQILMSPKMPLPSPEKINRMYQSGALENMVEALRPFI